MGDKGDRRDQKSRKMGIHLWRAPIKTSQYYHMQYYPDYVITDFTLSLFLCNSGQWMTEKRGGSDVSGSTETIATPLENDTGYYSIAGNKWFSSACDRY